MNWNLALGLAVVSLATAVGGLLSVSAALASGIVIPPPWAMYFMAAGAGGCVVAGLLALVAAWKGQL